MRRVLGPLHLGHARVLISLTTKVYFSSLTRFYNRPRVPVFHIVPGATVTRHTDVALVSTQGTSSGRGGLLASVFGRVKLAVVVPRDGVTTTATLASYNVTCILGCIRTTVRTNVRVKVTPGSTVGVMTRSLRKTTRLLLGGRARPDIRVSGMAAPNKVAVGKVGRLRRTKFASTIVGTVGTSG